MGVRPLAPEIALLDVLLGIVPRPAAIGHEQREEDAHERRAGEEAAEGLLAEDEADDGGEDHGGEAGDDHLLEGRARGDLYAAGSVGLGVAVHEAGDLAELTPHLLDHAEGGAPHGLHGEGGDHHGHDAAQEEADHRPGLGEVDGVEPHALGVGGVQGQRGQRRRADGEALADGGGGVAERVELVGDLARLGPEVRHLGDAARVVGDRPVGVHAHGDPDRGEHPDPGQRDAVQPRRLEGHVDRGADGHHREGGRLEPDGEPGDDVGGGAGPARLRDLHHALARGV